MKEAIGKSMQLGQIVDSMYISKSGEVTKRGIKVFKASANRSRLIVSFVRPNATLKSEMS